jgi:hypothetical protein
MEQQVERTIRAAVDRLAQLNENNPFSYDSVAPAMMVHDASRGKLSLSAQPHIRSRRMRVGYSPHRWADAHGHSWRCPCHGGSDMKRRSECCK